MIAPVRSKQLLQLFSEFMPRVGRHISQMFEKKVVQRTLHKSD